MHNNGQRAERMGDVSEATAQFGNSEALCVSIDTGKKIAERDRERQLVCQSCKQADEGC